MTTAFAAAPAAQAGTQALTATAAAAGKGRAQSPADAFAALLQALGAGQEGTALPLAGELPDGTGEAAPAAAPDTPHDPAMAAAVPVPITPALPAAMLAVAGHQPDPAAHAAGATREPGPGLHAVDGPAAKARRPQAAGAGQGETPPLAAATGTAPALSASAQAAEAAAAPAITAAVAAREGADPAPPRVELPPALALHAGLATAAPRADAPVSGVPVHQAAVPSHPLDAAFAGDVAAEVKLMAEGGLQQAELRLNPAELGPLRIHLSLSAQTADLSFTAAHATTREGITQALPALRELLADQGLQLGHAGVGSGDTGRPPQDQGWQAPREAAAGGLRAVGGTGGTGASQPVTVQVRQGRGMLDLYA